MILVVQGTLTPAMQCCESGRVDGCGVCDGFDLCESSLLFDVDADSGTAMNGALRTAFVAEFKALACAALGFVQLCSKIAVHRIEAAPAPGGRRLLATAPMRVRSPQHAAAHTC